MFHDTVKGVDHRAVVRLCFAAPVMMAHILSSLVSGFVLLCATQEGATWQSAHAFASHVFWSAAAAAQLKPQQQDQQNQQQQQQAQQPKLQLQLFSWDGGPRPMPSGTNLEQHNHRFKTLRVTVSDIRSRSTAHPGMVLGNVLYMDSFVDVSLVPCWCCKDGWRCMYLFGGLRAGCCDGRGEAQEDTSTWG
jgi:hypothetical protein